MMNNATENNLRFMLRPVQRGLLLLLLVLLGYVVASVLSALVLGREVTAARVSIVTVVQDIFVFIVPALVAALLSTRRPAELLGIDVRPGAAAVIVALLCLLCSIPAMNMVVDWNANVELPRGLGEMANWMRAMEESANNTLKVLFGNGSVMNLIMALLVVGVFAGFSEELLFRGAIQRMMITANVNAHVAIWVTAFIFSAVHLQFFGFVPRLLLGAMFGYMAWWSGSVWLSVAAHVTNNALAATSMWLTARGATDGMLELNKCGTESPLLVVTSVIVTATMLAILYKITRRKKIPATAD
ncbi:MAG: CPBP family intramembrane metalloprotease [Firmicutes bacterium]|nr:CPBP family intramembrane metalloprotease [Bacillota bacterium]MCM1401939.1 CPBP family intramembrane metalloprotease [Bacteroides sp.]MCM1477846.1 CPBP family intramembrane metalloprotease [Bacteroides sp.]